MEGPFEGTSGLIWTVLRDPVAGLRAAYRGEDAFRQEVRLAAILVPAAALLHVSFAWQVLLVAAVMLLLIAGLLHAAVNAAIDRRPPGDDPLADRAKRTACTVVQLASGHLAVVWSFALVTELLTGA